MKILSLFGNRFICLIMFRITFARNNRLLPQYFKVDPMTFATT